MEQVEKIYNLAKQTFRHTAPGIFSFMDKRKLIIKYLAAGGTATAVDLGSLFLLTELFNIHYLISTILAFIIAFFVSFYLQKFWTFRDGDKEKIFQQMSMYLTLGLINLVVNSVLMYILVDHLKIMYLAAQVLATLLISIINFLVYRLIIFKKKAIAPETAEAGRIRLLIATGIFPPDIGGPAFMIEALAGSLLANGLEVSIVAYADQGRPVEARHGQNGVLKIYRISRSRKFISYPAFFFRLLTLSFAADMIYVTDIYSVGFSAYLIKKLMRKKYIVRFAGDAAWETAVNNGWTNDYIADFQKKTYSSKIEKLKARRKKIMVSADSVIAVSHFLEKIADQIGVQAEKIRMIYNSVDFMDDKAFNREDAENIKKQYGQNAKIIVTACRLTKWKGVGGIIKAMPLILKKIGPVNFLVLGDGAEQDDLKRLAAEYKIAENVFFLGRVDHGQVQDYMKAADLFILNTNYEGLSHALLGAMKAGVPVISSRAGGNAEVIEDGKEGFLFDYNNTEAIADLAAKILTNGDLAGKFRENGFRKLEKFKWENTIALTVNTIKEVYYA